MLGRSPKRNLFLNVGHGHIGWTMSMGSARAVADIVAGKAPGIDLSGLTLADACDGDCHAGVPHPPRRPELRVRGRDRKSVVYGKGVSVRVDLGGRRVIKKKKHRIKASKNTPPDEEN